MIRINLARKKKSGLSAGTTIRGGADAAASLKSMSSGEGARSLGILLFKVGVPLALGIGANYGFEYYVEQQQGAMKQEIANIDAERTKVEKKLAEYRGFEEQKKMMEQNQSIIRKKIETIEKLIQNRDFAAKALIHLAQALPKDAWITELERAEKNYSIRGTSLDAGLVSDFMIRLEKGIYIKDVQLKKTAASDAAGSKSDFELAGRGDE